MPLSDADLHDPVPTSAASVKVFLERQSVAFLGQLSEGDLAETGQFLGQRRAADIDRLIRALYASASERLGRFSVAVAGVGSYGRGAVAFKSDADVRLIVPPGAANRERAAAFAEALLYPLWDGGLPVGHQILDVGEAIDLAHQDLATATCLLDLRHVAGDPELTAELMERAFEGPFSQGELAGFFRKLEEEASLRHLRFGASVYLLEPEVKSGAGGLRDLDAARWAARARFQVGSEGAPVWQGLVRLGVLVQREAQEIAAAEELLWRIRNRLHAHAGRRADRLSFDEQEQIGVELGFDDGKNPASRSEAAERLMQQYYLEARVVLRSRERILLRATPPKRRARPQELDLGGGLRVFDGALTIASTAELSRDPALALRLYTASARQGLPVLPFARDSVARVAADPVWCEALRGSREAQDAFVELICTVGDLATCRGSVAGELNDIGLLLAMLPEFRPVTGRVHHDVYHVYTVDVHSVAAVDCLRALCRGDLAQERPLASRLAAEIARPKPLFLATLLHDVGKGYPDASGSRKNHSASGAELCDHILPRLGFTPDDVSEARRLVQNHLAMYHVATRRDLDDPATIRDFVANVGGREGLRNLYLLTVADISTTSPTAMTSWKARMLDELYFLADAYLAGEGDAQEQARLMRVRSDARKAWDGSAATLDEFLTSMPERYLLSNSPESIAAHARLVAARGRAPVRAGWGPSRHPEVAELCVVADDRPGLLASIAAAITAGGFEVLAAQVYSRSRGQEIEAVDIFWVRDRFDGAGAALRGMERLERDLEAILTGTIAPEELLERRTGTSPWRERKTPAVPPEVVFDERASPRHTVVEVFAKDRPGLLYTLARVFHEERLSIALSKINTEGNKVADVFYVSELDGSKLGVGQRAMSVRQALLDALAS